MMSIRTLALAAVVATGLLAFADKADAQVVYTSGYYTTPVVYSSYYAPAYTYPPAVTYTSLYPQSNVGAYWSGYSYRYPYSYSYPYYSGYYTNYPAYYSWRGRWW